MFLLYGFYVLECNVGMQIIQVDMIGCLIFVMMMRSWQLKF